MNATIEHFEKDLAHARQTGDLGSEGIALLNIGIVLKELGETTKAIEYAEAALVIYEQIKSPHIAKLKNLIEDWRTA
jgi:tetratricopeptide (TPR) repeat protein